MRDVCLAIVSILQPRLIRIPTGDTLHMVVNEFEACWNFPQVAGAIDGLHIPIVRPHKYHVDYFNRKHFYSIVLQVKKLFFYGIRGTANAWLNNYLTNRNQYVIADDHSSGMRLITCGVPQGSVLGPVLFLLYINDICNVSNLLKFVLFADDTNIFCSSTSLHDLQDTINRELDKLFVWFSVNRLSLNLGKTNYMLFRSRPPDNELALKINNVVLPRVAATKFLGIIIDDKLSWKPHIQSVKSKLSSVLSIMYKASKLINTTGMYTLYCSLFHPYLSYCNEIWGNTYTSNVKCLFTLQKKAIRLICNADRLAHTNAMFKDMSILKLSEFVKYKTAIVMFNIFHGTLPIQLQMRFTKYSSVYSTRQTKSFVMVQVRTNLKAMCLSVHGVKFFFFFFFFITIVFLLTFTRTLHTNFPFTGQ